MIFFTAIQSSVLTLKVLHHVAQWVCQPFSLFKSLRITSSFKMSPSPVSNLSNPFAHLSILFISMLPFLHSSTTFYTVFFLTSILFVHYSFLLLMNVTTIIVQILFCICSYFNAIIIFRSLLNIFYSPRMIV